MSTYLVVTALDPTLPPKTHDEIVASICRTGFYSPTYRQYQVHGIFPYWSQAKSAASMFADKMDSPVQIITLYLAGDHMISETVEPTAKPTPATDPLTIEDLALDPYDGVPADTGTV